MYDSESAQYNAASKPRRATQRQVKSPLLVSGAVLVCMSVACAAGLPAPAIASHPTTAYERVPYPPPPARPEFVPKRPEPGAVWIDGEWAWRGIRWAWIYGRWVRPMRNAAWAPWAWRRSKDGQLWVARGTWRNLEGRALAHPRALRLASAGEGDRVDDEGAVLDVGPNERARKRRWEAGGDGRDCRIQPTNAPGKAPRGAGKKGTSAPK
jgi:hypothetical protein